MLRDFQDIYKILEYRQIGIRNASYLNEKKKQKQNDKIKVGKGNGYIDGHYCQDFIFAKIGLKVF